MTERSAADREAQTTSTQDDPAGSTESEAMDEGPEPSSASSSGRPEESGADEELARSLDDLQGELQGLNDRYLRLAAEFTNYRRRQEAEMAAAWGRAQADLVRRLLDVLDDLQRVSALDPTEESVTVESIVEGIDLVERKFVRALDEAGAEIVDPAEGDPFDPEMMEAMMRVPAEDDGTDDTVAGVFQKGYTFKGHLLRPARVSVYKAS